MRKPETGMWDTFLVDLKSTALHWILIIKRASLLEMQQAEARIFWIVMHYFRKHKFKIYNPGGTIYMKYIHINTLNVF